jgi:hypothetical protein
MHGWIRGGQRFWVMSRRLSRCMIVRDFGCEKFVGQSVREKPVLAVIYREMERVANDRTKSKTCVLIAQKRVFEGCPETELNRRHGDFQSLNLNAQTHAPSGSEAHFVTRLYQRRAKRSRFESCAPVKQGNLLRFSSPVIRPLIFLGLVTQAASSAQMAPSRMRSSRLSCFKNSNPSSPSMPSPSGRSSTMTT